MPAYASACCLKRIQPMPNVPLAYVSVYQRMSDNSHTLAYAIYATVWHGQKTMLVARFPPCIMLMNLIPIHAIFRPHKPYYRCLQYLCYARIVQTSASSAFVLNECKQEALWFFIVCLLLFVGGEGGGGEDLKTCCLTKIAFSVTLVKRSIVNWHCLPERGIFLI